MDQLHSGSKSASSIAATANSTAAITFTTAATAAVTVSAAANATTTVTAAINTAAATTGTATSVAATTTTTVADAITAADATANTTTTTSDAPEEPNQTGDLREQDRFMPIANVVRIMRKAVPPHAKISEEAKETVQECVSEYISFVTGEANERCQREHRRMVTGEDIIWAMSKLGFDNYVGPLTRYLQRYRESTGTSTRREHINYRPAVMMPPPPPPPPPPVSYGPGLLMGPLPPTYPGMYDPATVAAMAALMEMTGPYYQGGPDVASSSQTAQPPNDFESSNQFK